MIQEVNFWIQFVCGIIVGRGVIAETNAGRRFLEKISNITKSCLTDLKANIKVLIFLCLVLFFVFDTPPLIALFVLGAWLRIPDCIKEYQEEIFFKKGFWNRFLYWLGFASASWFFSDNPISHIPFSWFLNITHNTCYIFIYGTTSMIVLAILFDCIILYVALGLQKFISGSRFFVVATIMFFVVCPIVEYSKWNTFQDIIKSIEVRKESFLNRFSSLLKKTTRISD